MIKSFYKNNENRSFGVKRPYKVDPSFKILPRITKFFPMAEIVPTHSQVNNGRMYNNPAEITKGIFLVNTIMDDIGEHNHLTSSKNISNLICIQIDFVIVFLCLGIPYFFLDLFWWLPSLIFLFSLHFCIHTDCNKKKTYTVGKSYFWNIFQDKFNIIFSY